MRPNRILPFAFAMVFALVFRSSSALSLLPPDDESDSDTQEEVMPVAPADAPPPTPLNPKWAATDFAGQKQALGWSTDVFKVPDGMEDRVQFWTDIYTKYTQEQGILHDSKYITLVYESLDFSDITKNATLSDRQKEKARRKRVNDKKKEIALRLKHLQTVKDGDKLEGDDRRYWELFTDIDEPKKFIEAARRGRLRFQLGQRNQFVSGIYQSGRYMKQMEEIFKQEGLPLELTRLPFVESSFNLRARSKVGASGLWQFMKSAARSYMRMDKSADERNDPLYATRAAAKKLRENYQLLGSWPLAITAYNRGPAGVKRLTEKEHTTNIVELIDVRRGRFGFASANFFASFLAALEVERNADKYFGTVEILPELRGAEIKLSKSASYEDLLKYFNNDLDQAKLLNPHVTESVWKGKMKLDHKHLFRVPPLSEKQARGDLE